MKNGFGGVFCVKLYDGARQEKPRADDSLSFATFPNDEHTHICHTLTSVAHLLTRFANVWGLSRCPYCRQRDTKYLDHCYQSLRECVGAMLVMLELFSKLFLLVRL
jgi:hypothetical protein